jgi:hypothetical protein
MSLNVATFLFLQGKNILPTCKGVNEQREELVLERDFPETEVPRMKTLKAALQETN